MKLSLTLILAFVVGTNTLDSLRRLKRSSIVNEREESFGVTSYNQDSSEINSRTLAYGDSCIICNDIDANGMAHEITRCASVQELQKKCNRNILWKNNKICRFSCSLAGYPYLGDACCGITKSTPFEPSYISDSPVSDSPVTVTISPVTDSPIISPPLTSTLSPVTSSPATTSPVTFEPVTLPPVTGPPFTSPPVAERDYIFPTKSPTSKPSSSPSESPMESCIVCSDARPDEMEHLTCVLLSHSFSRKCNRNIMWRNNKYCQLSCYKAGYGYDGDICCDE
mmetsp:Transcript_2857/g.4257  ORF Transcript_2857/g.4257 Transcript_2857/m.4257 type:complete len:281 (+) Transcript_2857:115-957(+)